MPVIATLGRLGQEGHTFKASLGYVARDKSFSPWGE